MLYGWLCVVRLYTYQLTIMLLKHESVLTQSCGIFDMSVAFDIVNHNALFPRLKDMFCLSSKILEWFNFFLYS